MRWLPPLTALRTFEAVGRFGMAEAAASLNVTHAALSHQIRSLEAELGVTLFNRAKNGLELNATGAAYLRDITAAFDLIHSGTRRLQNPARAERLIVDSLTSFANDFLIPRLGRFYDENPEIQLELQTLSHGNGPIQIAKTGAHVAIRGGGVPGEWPGFKAEQLAHEVYFPVCAPALLEGANPLRTPKDLAAHTLLDVSTTPEGWREWLRAAEAEGLEIGDIDLRNSLRFDTIHSAMLAAIQGIGIGLGRGPLVDSAIEAGQLVAPFPLKVASTLSYWLVYPNHTAELPAFNRFREWLFRELERARAV